MFPDKEVLETWVAEDDERQRKRATKKQAEAKIGAKSQNSLTGGANDPTPPSTTTYPELGFRLADNKPSSERPTASAPPASGAVTASQVFLGAAISGFVMSDKRVMKYVKKKFKNK